MRREIELRDGHAVRRRTHTGQPSHAVLPVNVPGIIAPRGWQSVFIRYKRRRGRGHSYVWRPIPLALLTAHLLAIVVLAVVCCVHAARWGKHLNLWEFLTTCCYWFVATGLGAMLAIWGDEISLRRRVRHHHEHEVDVVYVGEHDEKR